MSDKGLKYPSAHSGQSAPYAVSGSRPGGFAGTGREDYGTNFDSLLETLDVSSGGGKTESAAVSRISVSAVGWVRSSLDKLEDCPAWSGRAPEAVLEILPDFVAALDGLRPGLTITVVTWLHLAARNRLRDPGTPALLREPGTPALSREPGTPALLREPGTPALLHEPGTPALSAQTGARGVFAGCGANRPNPVGIHRAVILKIEKQAEAALVWVNSLEALDGTPVLDIKYDSLPEQGLGEDLAGLKKKLVNLCARAHTFGLMSGFNGNASLRRGNFCIVTGRGAFKGALHPEDLAVLDLGSGELLEGKRPSSEAALHLEIYRSQPEAGVILHTHPPKLLALSLRLPGLPMQERLNMPVVEYGGGRYFCASVGVLPPGGGELARAVAAESKIRQSIWMEGHGLCVWGADAMEVLGLSEGLEHLAEVRILSEGAH
ncbi:MAG: TrmO family methyltransferase [Deltaproteobacteria bacterium]|nr:TrmO family methyltransferase [Deltaproteobacteria bacterium]